MNNKSTQIATLAIVAGSFLLLGACKTTDHAYNDMEKEQVGYIPPVFEAPFEQNAQPVDKKYASDYRSENLPKTYNETPKVHQPLPYNHDDETIPTAIPVKNKPGFVTSPYAPEKGLVDVRDFPPGLKVRDPYTNRIMRVPSEEDETKTQTLGPNESQYLPNIPPLELEQPLVPPKIIDPS